MLLQNSAAEGINFYKLNGLKSAQPAGSQGKPADAAECVEEAQGHSTPSTGNIGGQSLGAMTATWKREQPLCILH